MRVGIGYDVHQIKKNRPLFLGGVKVDVSYGLKGHSDADVLIHALIDAILGAIGEGDIGTLFPDTDRRYKDISSIKLLDTVYNMMLNRNYELINADLILIAEKPKINIYKEKIEKKLGDILNTDPERINLKATTTEGLGYIGRKEGIGAQAVVLLKRK